MERWRDGEMERWMDGEIEDFLLSLILYFEIEDFSSFSNSLVL